VLLWLAFWAAEAARAGWPGAPAGGLAALPIVGLAAGAVWLALTPVRFAQSRAHERWADRFALQLTGEARAFGAAVRRLSERHLAEAEPTALVRWFFHRHPPVGERLRMAEQFTEASSAPRR
jgi:STE24 endopeptidase